VRRGKKGHDVWSKGTHTVTVPHPHGGSRFLKVWCVSRICTVIDQSVGAEDPEANNEE
jgi:hypothetical protein